MLITLFWIVAVLVVAGLLLYLLNAIPGIDPTIHALIRVVVIIVCVIFVLYFVFSMLSGVAVPSPHFVR